MKAVKGFAEARMPENQFYEFGPFILDTVQHLLLKGQEPVTLTPKAYDALLVLVRNSGRMLSKEELMAALWPESFVEESNLTQQVSMIRKALGESPGQDRYIVTVPGRGYRFAAQVRAWSKEKPPATADRPELVARVEGTGKQEQRPSLTLAAPEKVLRMESRDASKSGAAPELEISKTTTDPESISISHQAGEKGKKRRARIAIAVLVLLMIALVVGYSMYRKRASVRLTLAGPRSLAILPFQNLRLDSESDFLGFSLADAVITKLDYVRSLTVRPSTAVQKYRNQVIDIPKVAADLNVDTLLTGTFIRDGDELRITYQLIEAKTDKILGRGTIDLRYEKLLTVQDNVAQQIIKELAIKLSPSEAQSIGPGEPVIPLAYENYLRGLDLYSRHDFPPAIKMLEKSTAIDPNYALSWAYLGAAYTSDAAFEFGGRDQYDKARAAYERALSLQPGQLEAKIFLANLLIDTGKVEEAVPLLREALKTNPNHAEAHWELGYAYRFAGMLEESIVECERARQLDPLVKANGSALNSYLYLGQYDKFLRSLPDLNDSAFVVFYRGFGEYYQKNWEQAAKDFDRAFMLDPTLYTQIGKALSDSIAHRDSEGLEILRSLETKIEERGVGDPEAMYKIAQAYLAFGDKASALRTLRLSIENGFFCYPYFTTDPLLDGLRNEPEFTNLLNMAHLRHEAFKNSFF
jgi:DNA-binding winged helix-turn-helix (wHTH) protein/TolB-like protein/Tfp pilus assembly protein PilF